MRSTRRNELGLALGVTAALLGACVVSAAFLPAPPSAPRYAGRGASTPRSYGTLKLAAGSNVRTLDPHIAYDTLSILGVRLLHEGLLDYDREGNFVPRIAASMPDVSDDGLTFTFTLRRGVRFSDGTILRADHVRASLERLLSPEVSSPGATFFLAIVGADAYVEGRADHVEGIRVLGEDRIEFTLKEPDQTFLNAIAMTFAYPFKVVRDRNGRANHVGVGPYVLDRWERSVELRFRRRNDYHAGGARAENVVVEENLDGPIATARFRNGDLDILQSPPSLERRRFRRQPGYRGLYAEQDEVAVSGLTMNCEIAPLDDVHLRRAIAFALDRPSRVRLANGSISAAGQALPPALPGYQADFAELQRTDLARARAELALSRYPDGVREPIRVIVRDDAGGRQSFEMLQQDLAAIHVAIAPVPMSFAQYLAETGKRRRAQAFYSAWSMDFPDPSNFLDILFHSRSIHEENSENRSFYVNAELDALLDAGRRERDRERRIDLYRRANVIVARDAPWAFVAYPRSMEIWQPYVKGYRPHPIWSLDVRDVWIDGPRVPFTPAAMLRIGGRR